MSSRKKSDPKKPEIEKESDYYKLKTKAVDDLVNANEANSPHISEEELRKYRSGPKLRIPELVKILFIKAWFPGAVCYFFIWGLGNVLGMVDILFVTGMALGIVTDLLTNNVLRFFAKTEGGNDRWMMISRKGYISFPLNILYGYVVLLFVFLFYNAINLLAAAVTGDSDRVFLGVEPVLFGVICMGVDMLMIQIKHFFADVRKGVRAERPR